MSLRDEYIQLKSGGSLRDEYLRLKSAAGRTADSGNVADATPPPSNYGQPTGSLPTRMFAPVVRGIKSLVAGAGELARLTDEDIQKTVLDPSIEKEREYGPGLRRGGSEAFRAGIGGAQFLTTGMARFADELVNPEKQGLTVGGAVKSAGTGLIQSGKAILPQGGELYRHGVQNLLGTENPPDWTTAPADLADKAAGLMMTPEEIAQAKETVNRDPFAPFGTGMVLAGGLKGATGLVRRGMRPAEVPRETIPTETTPTGLEPRPEPISELGRATGIQRGGKTVPQGMDVGEAPEPMIRTPKATTGTPEVRAIKEAPTEQLQSEIRQMGRIPDEKLSTLPRSDLEFVASGGRIGRPSKALIGLGIAGITATGAYYLTGNEDQRAQAAGFGAAGLGLAGLVGGKFREAMKDKGGKPAPVSPQVKQPWEGKVDAVVDLSEPIDRLVYEKISGLSLDKPRLDTRINRPITLDGIRKSLGIEERDAKRIQELALSLARLTEKGVIEEGPPVGMSVDAPRIIPTLRASVANRYVAERLLSKPAVSPQGGGKGKIALGAAGVATGAAAYSALNDDDRKDVASAALGIGVLGAGMMRSPLKEGGGKLTGKEMRAGVRPEKVAPGINLDKIEAPEATKKVIGDYATRLQSELSKKKGAPVTFKEVEQAAAVSEPLAVIADRAATKQAEIAITSARMQQTRLGGEIEKSGKASPETWKQLGQNIAVASSWATDAGRRLGAYRINAGEARQPYFVEIVDKLTKAGHDLDAVAARMAKVDVRDARQVTEAYRDFEKWKVNDLLDEIAYINLLSSPNTQIVNLTGNLSNLLLTKPATTLLTGGMDAVASKLIGRERTVYANQRPYFKGVVNAAPDAIARARDAFTGKSATERPDVSHIPTNAPVVKEFYFITRAMEAGDQFVRAFLEGGIKEELAATAKRQGKGIDLEKINEQARDQAEKWLYRAKLDPKNESGQGHLLSFADQVTAQMLRLREAEIKGIKPIKWYLRFVMTPSQIAKMGVEYSPLGIATIPGNTAKMQQVAKTMIGSTVYAGAAYWAFQGNVTWAPPRGESQRRAFYDAHPPYSVKIGNDWYSYTKLGPFAFPLALAAATNYYVNEQPKALSDDQWDKLGDMIKGTARYFSDQSYMDGVNDLVKGVAGEESLIKNVVSNPVRQFVPLVSFQTWVNTMLDPVFRKGSREMPQGFIDDLKKSVIGLSDTVEPYTDAKGRVILRPSPYINAFSPVRTAPGNTAAEANYRRVQQRSQIDKLLTEIKQAVKSGDTAKANELRIKLAKARSAQPSQPQPSNRLQ